MSHISLSQILDIGHRDRAYTVFQAVRRPGVYSAVSGTVHYEEPLKLFDKSIGHRPDYVLPSVAILP